MKWLRKFLRLPSRDRFLLIHTTLLMGAIRLGLWLLPFRVLWHLATQMIWQPSLAEPDPASINRVVWAVERVSCLMPGVKCLARALTAQRLLKQQGHSTQIRIGVAKNAKGQLEAHAWVEYQGRVVIGGLDNLERYTPLPTWQGERA